MSEGDPPVIAGVFSHCADHAGLFGLSLFSWIPKSPVLPDTAPAASASKSPPATPGDASPAQSIVRGWCISLLHRRRFLWSLLCASCSLRLALRGHGSSVCPAAAPAPARHGTASEGSCSIKSWHIYQPSCGPCALNYSYE